MGGRGSGRPPSVETLIKQSQPTITPIGDGLFIPNYSGIQDAAKKTSSPLGTGGGSTDHAALSNLAYASAGHTGFQPAGSYLTAESDPIFMSLSGTFLRSFTEADPVFMSLSGSLPYLLNSLSGSLSYIPMSLSGSLPYVATETDPVFMSLSGSLGYVVTELDPVFMSLSGAFLKTETDPVFMSLSGSFLKTESDPQFMALSGGLPYLLLTASGSLAYIKSTDYPDFEISGSPTFMTLSGSLPYLLITASGSIAAYAKQTEFATLSGEFATVSGEFITLSGEFANLSGSFQTINTEFPILSGEFSTLSGSFATINTEFPILSGEFATLSGSYTTHAADTTDPHGATLTQTYLTLTSGSVTADITTSGSALIRNFLIGTETSGSLTASNYPQGTIYLKYT